MNVEDAKPVLVAWFIRNVPIRADDNIAAAASLVDNLINDIPPTAFAALSGAEYWDGETPPRPRLLFDEGGYWILKD